MISYLPQVCLRSSLYRRRVDDQHLRIIRAGTSEGFSPVSYRISSAHSLPSVVSPPGRDLVRFGHAQLAHSPMATLPMLQNNSQLTSILLRGADELVSGTMLRVVIGLLPSFPSMGVVYHHVSSDPCPG